jgi:hypothetical protein
MQARARGYKSEELFLVGGGGRPQRDPAGIVKPVSQERPELRLSPPGQLATSR